MAHIDVISDILSAAVKAFPESNFVQSLAHQYMVRGWLTKKQLEGLYNKVQKVTDIPPGKLATLQAQIQKMPNRYKSSLPEATALYTKDNHIQQMLAGILAKYPQHKRVLYLQTKFNNNEPLTSTETAEVEKFYKLLINTPTPKNDSLPS